MSGQEGASSDENNELERIQEEIDVKYPRSQKYIEFPAIGARGGVQPRNDFRIDFFTEHFGTPKGEKYDVNDEQIGSRSDPGEVSLIREIQGTAVLSQEKAFSISAWIISSLFGVPQEQVEKDMLERYENSAEGK